MKVFFLLVLLGLCSCALYEECDGANDYDRCVDIAREYRRVTYYESEFLPFIEACKSHHGFLLWNHGGAMTGSLHRRLEKGDYGSLSLGEMRGAKCASGMNL